jgi:hypothetical protein
MSRAGSARNRPGARGQDCPNTLNESTQIYVNELLPRRVVLSSVRLSATDPPRSALPLAAVGIACLGIVPVFGGPDRALHWAMTAAMVGVGVLLWSRHRLSLREGPLRPVAPEDARRAGKAVLLVCGVVALLVLGIIALQWRRGGQLGGLSLAMPLVALVWVATLGVRSLRHGDPSPPGLGKDRPSWRPSKIDGLPSTTQRPSQPPTDGRVSA